MIPHNRAAGGPAAALQEDHVGTITLGLIVGNRGFFPDHLCDSGRRLMLEVLQGAGVDVVALGPADTKSGSVESCRISATNAPSPTCSAGPISRCRCSSRRFPTRRGR
jgi:hypothetical protein